MAAVLGNRHAVLAREVTKLHEEFLRGRLQHLLPQIKKRRLKGEITVLVAPADREAKPAPARPGASLRARLERLQRRQKLDFKSALKQVARELGIKRSEAYRRFQEEKALGE